MQPESKRRWLASLVSVVVTLAIIGLLDFLSRPAPPVGGGIRLLGYNTNAAGVRFVEFEIKNLSQIPLERSSSCEIQMLSTNGWQTLPNASAPIGQVPLTLRPQAVEIVTAQVPAVTGTWRLSINYHRHRSTLGRKLKEIDEFLHHLGVGDQPERSHYAFYSEPLTP